MKLILSVILLLSITFSVTCSFANDQDKANTSTPLLSEAQLAAIDKAVEVRIEPLAAMRVFPSIVYPGDYRTSVTLLPNEREEISKMLKSAMRIDPKERTSTCKYEPGIRITYFPEAQKKEGFFVVPSLITLLCFNCDIWALAPSDPPLLNNSVSVYGDSRLGRKELLRIAKAAFNRADEDLHIKGFVSELPAE